MIQSTFSLFRFETRAALGKQAALDVAATIRALLAKQPRVRMVFAAAPSQDEFLAALREDTSIDFGRIAYINGFASDTNAACAEYAQALCAAPIDIVCMGIGENGHIAFNDPHEADLMDPLLVKRVSLDEVCRMQQVHDGCFAKLSDVPTHAITLTVPALMRAKFHFCMVPAASKCEAVYRTVHGPIGPECPASALRLCRHANLYVDRDSGAKLAEVLYD